MRAEGNQYKYPRPAIQSIPESETVAPRLLRLIQRKEERSLLLKNDGMNITLHGILQFLAFSMATLLATGILVLAGLNENGRAESNLASISFTGKDSR